MKRFILIIGLLMSLMLVLSAQYNRDMEYKNHIGAEILLLNTSICHRPEISLNIGMQKARKSLAIGTLYQVYNRRISGTEIRYRIYFGDIRDGFYFTRNF